jgi:hypothetical protein
MRRDSRSFAGARKRRSTKIHACSVESEPRVRRSRLVRARTSPTAALRSIPADRKSSRSSGRDRSPLSVGVLRERSAERAAEDGALSPAWTSVERYRAAPMGRRVAEADRESPAAPRAFDVGRAPYRRRRCAPHRRGRRAPHPRRRWAPHRRRRCAPAARKPGSRPPRLARPVARLSALPFAPFRWARDERRRPRAPPLAKGRLQTKIEKGLRSTTRPAAEPAGHVHCIVFRAPARRFGVDLARHPGAGAVSLRSGPGSSSVAGTSKEIQPPDHRNPSSPKNQTAPRT